MSEGFKYKFKLLRGRHVDDNGKYDHKENNTIFTDQDLRKIDPAGAKFMLLAIGGVNQEPESLQQKPIEQEELLTPDNQQSSNSFGEEDNQVDDDLLETLEGMKLPELKEMAADNEIDLQGATKKSDIIEILSEQMAAV